MNLSAITIARKVLNTLGNQTKHELREHLVVHCPGVNWKNVDIIIMQLQQQKIIKRQFNSTFLTSEYGTFPTNE